MTQLDNTMGAAFSAWLGTLQNFADPAILRLMKKLATSSPNAAQIEAANSLLGPWTGTGFKIPVPMTGGASLTFPADHGDHWDYPVEWTFYTLNLDLPNGGKVNIVNMIFRKAFTTEKISPKLSGIERQIYSTSTGITIKLPGEKETVHYSLPVVSASVFDGGVEASNNPVRRVVGKNSMISINNNVFPCRLSYSDSGDVKAGRPPISWDITAGATNPPFLQGYNGYVGQNSPTPIPSSPAWYYYSWCKQPATGTVTIGNVTHRIQSGLAWMDHQWGGSAPPVTAAIPAWIGWSWFALEFDTQQSISIACPHGAIVNGRLPSSVPGFGTYVYGEGSEQKSCLVLVALEVDDYTPSTQTKAAYPSSWKLHITSLPEKSPVLDLRVVAKTDLKQQALWMGGQTEYAEASVELTASGTVDGVVVVMKGVGFCESVGFEDPKDGTKRTLEWLGGL